MKGNKKNLFKPRHVAIIMDGNNRWAKNKGYSGVEGHQKGVQRAREAVEFSVQENINVLSLFAFSSENWGRSEEEVSLLMSLLTRALEEEVPNLIKNQVQLKFIGDLKKFDNDLRGQMKKAEFDTKCSKADKKLDLIIAASYGGRWDILQALKRFKESKDYKGELTEKKFGNYLSLKSFPDPDLCIRTGGEYRVSNFFLWHLAYSELYFSKLFWPDFDSYQFSLALEEYSKRNRRFGDLSNFKKN